MDRDLAHYEIPKTCEECGSDDIVVRVLFDTKILRYKCNACGNSRSLPKVENLNKRSNTTLNHWASQIIKHRPCCYVCGSPENLEAHHIIPVSHSEKYKYWSTNGITLCHKCHQLVHKPEVII